MHQVKGFAGLDWSARGMARVIAWTVGGTLGAMVVAVGYDLLSLGPIDSDARVISMIGSVGIPLVLAPGLFLFFTLKVRELAITQEKLRIAATTDGLTGILNRGAFIDAAERILETGKKQSGALLVIDADHFKVINDRFGHHAGDEALVVITNAIRGVLRTGDLVGRLGGEEFGVFLPGTEYLKAAQIAERIRVGIERAALSSGRRLPELTVSVGGAMFDDPVEFSALFRVADRRLYEAKGAGRNRTAIGPMTEFSMDADVAEAV